MVRISQPVVLAVACIAIVVLSSTGGCASKSGGSGFPGGPSSSSGTSSGSSGDDGGGVIVSSSGVSSGGFSSGFGGSNGGSSGSTTVACTSTTGWCTKVDTSCSTPTSLTGKVYDPAMKNPIYDVVVFIPNDETKLPKITQGTHSCQTCDVSVGDYVSAVNTKLDGTFTLSPVPTGSNVPIVVQIGKWRRITHVNITKSCGVNTTTDKSLHLPGKKADGDMPQLALLTGGCDDMACFLLNVGIDPAEFTGPHAGGRLDVYQGNSMPLGFGGAGPNLDAANGTAGNCTGTSCPLWSSKASFEAYDIALLSCECSEQGPTGGATTPNETTAGYTNLHDWLNEGGKVFASHYHYTWFRDNPDPKWKATATWLGTSIAGGMGTYDVDTSFPKGVTFGSWLNATGALTSTGPPPTIMVSSVATSVSTVNKATTLRWIYDPAGGNDTKYLSFNTPIGGLAPSADAGESGQQYCGKAVFTDLHTSSGLLAKAANVPSGCGGAMNLTPQQKALEFLFFDLSACVSDDTKPPPGPPPPLQ